MVSLFGSLAARVVYLQLGDHTELRRSYNQRVVYRKELKGSRGRILDRNGRVLAQDEARRNIAVDPSFVHLHSQPEQVRDALNLFLHVEPALIGTRLANTDRKFSYLEKFVDEERASELDAYLKESSLDKGVVFEKVQTRTYPHDNLLAHVVGFENHDGVGSAGIEQEMNRFLKGKGGLRVGQKDGRRRELVSRRELQIDPEDGADVKLTVDQYLQFGVEEALDKALVDYNAKGGWAVVMDVKTGAILAMASKPDYNLNEYNFSKPEERRNQTIGTVYEPGSIMKPLVFAAALNEGLVDPTEIIDCEYGRWIHRNRSLEDYHPYHELSAADVLKKSSNIGTAKIALRMSPEMMYDYLRSFGFGARTGLELPGEEVGILHHPRNWDSLTHSRMSIGHAVTVTALQMAVAMNVLANDGVRVTPYLVKEVRAQNGELLYVHHPDEIGHRVLRAQTARRMRHLLARVTETGGTGRRSRWGDYVVAGKTGTAEKVMEEGGYSNTKNRASFTGFFPAHSPELTIVVTIDEPTGDKRTGGSVAAPVFRDIAQYAAGYLGIPPEGL
jgi:cell division protein FtsI (penicillin-binding protein 3)